MQNSYDRIAEQWRSNVRNEAYLTRSLAYVDTILVDLPARARILDLGCGTGDPIAKYLVGKNFQVVGIDQSKKMLEIARQQVPEAELIHGDMVELSFPNGFSAAIAWDSLFHVDRRHHGTVFRKMFSCLKQNARLFLTLGGLDSTRSESLNVESDFEGFSSEMFGETFFYSAYDPEMSRKLLEASGFEIEVWEEDDSSSRGHLAIIARKKG